jgi:ankyrin repeat protein
MMIIPSTAFFLFKGAPVDAADDLGYTALHWACDKGHAAAASLLLTRGADPNLTDETGSAPIHLAVAGEHVAVVRALAEHGGTDVNAQDEDGRTPLIQVRAQFYLQGSAVHFFSASPLRFHNLFL